MAQRKAALLFDNNSIVLPKTSGVGIKVDDSTPTYGWKDLIGRIEPRDGGSTAPSLEVYRGGQVREWAFGLNDEVDLQFHMPHDYAPGTDVFVHVHWSHNGTAISGSLVCNFYSTWAKGFGQSGQIFGSEVNTTLTISTPDVATIPQYSHRVDEIQLSAATPTANQLNTNDFEVDGLFLINMKTTTIPTISGGTTAPFIHHVDIHYQTTNMPTKGKAPNFYT
jgi:hypothetical protein